jgi:FAD/FMN-containing dehydrogenase/Fe-S oxidoreductase
MDSERERIQADLRGLLQGEVFCDDAHTQLYAGDASLYEIRPVGIVRPRHTADVVAAVRYAAEHQLPIHARGAGSGLSGESLGPGLVIDFAHSMRRIVEVRDNTARVQPGVVHAQLNRALAPRGLLFGPDPAMSPVTTMGGVLAINGAGSHWLRYGSARERIESLQMVLADGTIIEAGRHPLPDPAAYSNGLLPDGSRTDGSRTDGSGADGSRQDGSRQDGSRQDGSRQDGWRPDALPSEVTRNAPFAAAGQDASRADTSRSDTSRSDASRLEAIGDAAESASPARLGTLVSELTRLIGRESAVIRTHRPRSLVNRSGYHLYDVLQPGHLDLARMLVGSEGTLGLITEATVRLDPLPPHRGVALLFCDRLEAAARVALEAAKLGMSACDLLDRRLLSIARELNEGYGRLIPVDVEAIVLVEQSGDDPRRIRDDLRRVIDRVQKVHKWAFDSRLAMEADEVEFFWRLATQVVSRLYSLRGPTRPLPFVEDFAVPPEELPDFFPRLQHVLKTHQTTATVFGHAGHGQLHIRPFLDLQNPDDVRRMPQFAADLYREVLAVGGTISGEHGDGLSRSWFVREQYGPLYSVFRAVKNLFDPLNLLNPGKVVADAPQPLIANLRSVPEPAPNLVRLELNWEPDELAQAAMSCNGCGHCRSTQDEVRMCPIFRFAPREEAAPRAKANLVRAVLAGQLPAEEMGGEALKAVADLCVNCHQCRAECPANVDIPKLVLETKAQFVAQRGLPSSDWLPTRLDTLAYWAGWLRPLTNWALGNSQARWLMDKLFGLAQGRKLPRLAPRNFLRVAARNRWTTPPRHSGPRVLYFVDTYVNWFDPQLGEAVVRVLDHNGVAVFVDPDQEASGMATLTAGDIERVKVQARRNIDRLAEAVRQGYTIVTSEPSAALCLTREYPKLFADDDTLLVAKNTVDVVAYLWRMHQGGKLELDLRPLPTTVGYHQPCHQRALYQEPLGAQLLRLIPGVTVHSLDAGCSGMAGVFGLKRANYRASLRAGWNMIMALRRPSLIVGASECSACKLQMEQGTTKPTVHPLKMLALAYGLMPELARKLQQRGEPLRVT